MLQVPFKVKMESIAQERYGQQVMPHFASYNANDIKSSARQAAQWHSANSAAERQAEETLLARENALLKSALRESAMRPCSRSRSPSPLELTTRRDPLRRPDSNGSHHSYTEREREREIRRERERERERESYREREIIREREYDRHKEREREIFRERERELEKEDREGYRERDSYRDRERDSYREPERDSYREREKDSYREREKESFREREKDSFRERDRDREELRERHFGSSAHRTSPAGSSFAIAITTAPASSSSKPKPCPIILAPTAVSPVPPPAHPQLPQLPPSSALAAPTSVTMATHGPIPSPTAKHPMHPMSSLAGSLHTPLFLSSPMLGGPRTPNPMLHFWSSLSPAVTLSPRLGSATGASAFQFPSYPGLAYSPVVATFPHPLDTPGLVPSPTSRSIPVL